MNRRTFLGGLAVAAAAPLVGRAALAATTTQREPAAQPGVGRLKRSKSEWRRLLPAPAYAVLFEEVTERAGSSPLNREKRAGTFVCAACQLPLFTSEAKYESGSGWPSFTQPMEGRVATKRDYKMVWLRTEYHCARCGGHQGHIFDDGPPPTGKRWCNNGLALRFVPADEPLPALRS